MSDLSKSVEGYRSYGNFYDDKKMKSDYDDYKTKISELEKKLNDYEDNGIPSSPRWRRLLQSCRAIPVR